MATDIAARGIDIEDISHVINYDIPSTPDDYIHRIGRTARAEATGDAFTLLAPDEEKIVKDIERTIGKTLPRVTLPDFDYKKGRPPGGPAHGHGARGHHGGHGGGQRRHSGGGHSFQRRRR